MLLKKRMVQFISTKKGQIWGMDLMIAITIFLVGLMGAYVYAINYSSEAGEILDEFFYEGSVSSSLFLSEGSPINWTRDNFDTLGITSNNRINQTKLDDFFQLNYPEMKRGLRAQHDFYINFTGIKALGENVEGFGKKPINTKNLVKIERFTIYENKPIKINFYIWEGE